MVGYCVYFVTYTLIYSVRCLATVGGFLHAYQKPFCFGSNPNINVLPTLITNKKNWPFCHSPVSYLAVVVDAH